MKIISKFKDFYDHKVAKYGIDPVLVFDRRHPSDKEHIMTQTITCSIKLCSPVV